MKDKLYKMMNWPEIEAIVYGEEGKPQTILGRHNVSSYTLFQTFQPNAKSVVLVIEGEGKTDKSKEYTMELADEAGFYAIAILGKIKAPYHYMVTDVKGARHKIYDPYDPAVYEKAVQFKKGDLDDFTDGGMYHAHRLLGATPLTVAGLKGVLFRVWAPAAIRVSVVGDFNDNNGKSHPMMKDDDSGIFSLFVPGVDSNAEYSYELHVKGGRIFNKLDPYATVNKGERSVIDVRKAFKWTDDGFSCIDKKTDRKKIPVSVYETDLKEFAGKTGKITDAAAKSFAADVADKGYNYIQCRLYGDTPYTLVDGTAANDLKRLVNALHDEGVGIIAAFNLSSFTDI